VIDLALIWHHHQPDYRDRDSGISRLPWVRLHGIKDYYGLAALLGEFPGVRATFNLVPSLLLQIDEYARGEGRDIQLELSRPDPASLTEPERAAVIDFFFSCNLATMIHPRPRYRGLLEKRNPGHATSGEVLGRFSDQDILDLQVLFNLVWFHPLVLEERGDLRELEARGRDFTEEDKALVLSAQQDVISRVIPLHRDLWHAGQIEVTTTPLYHPILPLLVDVGAAREAMPGVPLPARGTDWSRDAREQLLRGMDVFEHFFGRRPEGLWPSEGSVSQALLPLVAEAGFRWLATDEGILARSLGRGVERDGHDVVTNPDLLYRMYDLDAGGPPLSAIFRDRTLSDGVGFRYSRLPPEQAVDDFLGRLDAIKRRGGGPHVVPVILDGENAWEHFPGNGLAFLRLLHQRIQDDPDIRTVTPGALLEERQPTEKIERLFAGSWINENFSIWIGDAEDNRAWEMVARAREALLDAEREGSLSPEALEAAWDALYAAEGSDWYWWFGPEHTTDHADEFDRLFRSHVRGVYRALGRPHPSSVDRPVRELTHTTAQSAPSAFLRPSIDGRVTGFFEWNGAARYSSAQDSGVMDLPAKRIIEHVHFGFNRNAFLLRVDSDGPLADAFGPNHAIRVLFLRPQEAILTIRRPSGGAVETVVESGGEPRAGHAIRIAVDRILEMSVPFALLDLEPNDEVLFTLEVLRDDRVSEQAPRGGALSFLVPGDTFEAENWQV
jgi:alpha-amylase/alpha-mannosidase (GH57 family)